MESADPRSSSCPAGAYPARSYWTWDQHRSYKDGTRSAVWCTTCWSYKL